MMSFRRVLSCVLSLCLLAPGLAAETAAIPPLDPHLADAASAPVRSAYAAVLSSEALHDYGTSYTQLRQLRQLTGLSPELIQALDRHRAAIAASLGGSDLAQAARQEHDGQWAYAQRFYLQALAYDAAAALPLKRLWSDAHAVAVLGEDHDRDLAAKLGKDPGPSGVRWRLAALLPAHDWNAAERATDELERLLAEAGSQDPNLRAWTQQLLRALPTLPGDATAHLATIARLHELGAALFGATDAQVQATADFTLLTTRNRAIAGHGDHELTLSAHVGVGFMQIKSSLSASATPDAENGSFAAHASQASSSASGLATALDLRLMREATAVHGALTPLYGLGLQVEGGSATLAVPIADADSGPASLTGSTYQSRLSMHAIGLSLLGGARYRLGHEDGTWTLSGLVSLGLASVHDDLGFRPDVVNGATGSTTISASGVEPSIGLDADLVWRPDAAWSYSAGIGLSYLKLPSLSGTARTTFISSSGTSTSGGSVTTSVDDLRAQTLWLSLGVARSW